MRVRSSRVGWLCFVLAALPASAQTPAPGATRLEPVVVRGRQDSLAGVADTGSQGTVGAEQLADRPIFRPGEILETVPGLIVTQHSGEGKANQFFLRGFNLDHGIDVATSIDGVPVNLPSHGHGQGYTDLNFLIPELVERIDYRKGPYFADQGDFASAGAANLEYFDELPQKIARFEGGMFDYYRLLGAGSHALGPGTARKDSDIEYYCPSRLPGEPAGPDDGGFNDVHFHPVSSVSVRAGLTARF